MTYGRFFQVEELLLLRHTMLLLSALQPAVGNSPPHSLTEGRGSQRLCDRINSDHCHAVTSDGTIFSSHMFEL